MTPEQQVQWEELYSLLELARQHSIKLCIDPHEKISITIHTLGKEPSGCGRCQKDYNSFEITGRLWDLTESPKVKNYPYTGQVSQYYMHGCTGEEEDSEFSALYKVDRVNDLSGKYWHRFVDLGRTRRQVGQKLDRLKR